MKFFLKINGVQHVPPNTRSSIISQTCDSSRVKRYYRSHDSDLGLKPATRKQEISGRARSSHAESLRWPSRVCNKTHCSNHLSGMLSQNDLTPQHCSSS